MIDRGTWARTMLLAAALLVLLLSGCGRRETPAPLSLPESFPQSMKGYELYSWKSGQEWRFTLMSGTNRLKTVAEITSTEYVVREDWVKVTLTGVSQLKDALLRLAPGSEVIWQGAPDLPRGAIFALTRLELPPAPLVQEIQTHCTAQGIELVVAGR